MKVKSEWLKGLKSPEDRERLKEYIFHNQLFRERQTDILTRWIDESIILSDKQENYELSSWAEYQADQIGYRRALRKVIELLTLTGENE